MGASFVRRRMQAELGPDWRDRFADFDFKPAAAASLGQVHRAVSLASERLACKLQYPDMASAVETDLSNLDLLFSLHRRAGAAIDTREIAREIRERVREELDYEHEAKIARLYRVMLADRPFVRVPRIDERLSTRRLLTMQWLDGEPLVAFENAPQEARDSIAVGLFDAWWRPFLRYGVIHGDPHLGNYTVAASGEGRRKVEGVNLFDYGCVRVFPPRFVLGVVELYRALKAGDSARVAHAYEMWGFRKLNPRTTEAMNSLGPVHVRPHPRRSRAHRRRRRQTVGIWPARDGPGDADVEGRGRRPAYAARIRVPRARDHRHRQRVPASWRAAQLSSPV